MMDKQLSEQEVAQTCSGCGVPLQTVDATKLGLTPEKALSREPLVCQRCFRIKNYNELASVALNDSDFTKILGQIATK